jgi:hypothetical protein
MYVHTTKTLMAFPHFTSVVPLSFLMWYLFFFPCINKVTNSRVVAKGDNFESKLQSTKMMCQVFQ